MKNKVNLDFWCPKWEKECNKLGTNDNYQNWYEYNCKLVEKYCPKKMPIDTTLPMFLMLSAMFIIVLRFKPKRI